MHFCMLLYLILYCWLGLFLGICHNILSKPVKHKKYTIRFKKEIVRYAKEHSVNKTADKFGIHRKSIQKWKKKENCLNAVQRKHTTTFRLAGAERKVKHDTVE